MTKALVLSGGGPVGIAWQTGLAVGLAAAGISLADADSIIGTSAGSAVGAQIALGRDLSQQVERYRAGSTRPDRGGRDTTTAPPAERMQRLMSVMAELSSDDAGSPDDRRARIGRVALEAETMPEDQFVDTFRYLRDEAWPAGYACTAVDAETGAFVVWTERDGAPLDRCVASSCAVPAVFPPITVNGRRYIDGGMRSGTNADLAAGHDLVLVVSLMAARASDDPRAARARANRDSENAALRESGARVEWLFPDDASVAALGPNLMDGSRMFAAVEAGLDQGKRDAERLQAIWS